MDRTGQSGTRVVVDRRRWVTVANGLTFVRVLLAPACASAVAGTQALWAFTFFWTAVATDYVDGPIARHRGEDSPLGGLLDHASDAFFVCAGIGALASRGLAPPLLAPLVALAFIQYALDSRALAGQRLRTSPIGRWNGIAYYVLLGTPIVRDFFALAWPSDGLVVVLGWALLASTVISMLDRARAFLRVPRNG